MGAQCKITPEETVLVENINEYTIHNSAEERDLVVKDPEGELIVAKLSRRKARCMGGNKKWRQVRNLMEAFVKHNQMSSMEIEMEGSIHTTNVLGIGKIL